MERADLGAMVVRLGRRLIAMEEPILADHGISMWAYVALSGLEDGPTRTQAALASAIGADKTRLIPVLDDLQRRGLITREADPADRRVRLLGMTPAGRKLHAAVRADIRAAEEALLASAAEKDRAAFLAVLEALDQGR
ncbi:MarR family winged helix-turn-helix transcriptional regulator [Paractinoplanes atraurantiacus]|nr:MarR family transcriptional regulator [Actinoplanes atraurantiacus]